MQQLLQEFSTGQILMFIVILATAIKGTISFIDWARDRLRKQVHEKDKPNEILKKTQENKQKLDQIEKELNTMKKILQLLTNSDKDAIKSFITKQHHYFCYKLKYIDDYSLDAIEKRYAHYQEQGGNSFVKDLMEELRALPKKHSLSVQDYQHIEQR